MRWRRENDFPTFDCPEIAKILELRSQPFSLSYREDAA